MSAAATALSPRDGRSLAEREIHIARVREALIAWRPYLTGESGDVPARQYRAPTGAARLDALCERFGLDGFEADVVSTLWVLAFAPEWRSSVAALDASDGVTALAVARLHAHAPRPCLASDSPLLVWRMVAEHAGGACANPVCTLDPHILAWLEGSHELDRTLTPCVRLLAQAATLQSWPVERTAATIREALSHGDRVEVQVLGRDAGSAAAFASAVAAAIGLPLLAVGPGATDLDAHELFVRIERQAFLDRCALFWNRSAAREERMPWSSDIPWFPVQFVFAETPSSDASFSREIVVPLPPPSAAERRVLWLQALPDARAWDDAKLDTLARRYVAQPDDIAAVAAMRPASPDEAGRQLLARSRGNFGPLAQRLETSFAWDDLVVPTAVRDALRDIAFEANDRVAFWEQSHVARLFPQGRGLVALFCGPPGTGKTMAAQVIAAELGMDLYRVDLAAVVSKWVGETAQHLEKVLAQAADRNLALFFDEADALYGKRVEEVRDAQDRFANMDVSHLMVAIESYSGIVLLASNLKTNIDPAFIRRIRYCVEFPKPDRPARREIWRRVGEAMWGTQVASSLAAVLEALAEREVTGAQIKNACLSAAFTSRRAGGPPTRWILAHALARELTKDGQGISQRALASLAGEPRGNKGAEHG